MGVSALLILIFHEYVPLFQSSFLLLRAQELIRGYGYIGVDIFFILSGIWLVYSIQKQSLGEYYYKRIKRLIFPFVVVAVIIMVIDKWSVERFIKNILGITFFSESIYGYLWFVPAIFLLYLFFSLYFHIFNRQKKKLVFTIAFIIVIFILLLICSNFLREDFFCFLNRIPCFIIGVYLGWYSRNNKLFINRKAWFLLLLIMFLGLFLVASLLYFGMPRIVPLFEYSFPSLMIAVPLIFLTAKVFAIISKNIIGRCIKRVLCFYGVMSLELYCIQEFLGDKIIEQLSFYGVNSFIINIIVLLVLTLIAWLLYIFEKLFWVGFEKLFRRKSNNTA